MACANLACRQGTAAQQAGASTMSRQLPDVSSVQTASLWDMRHVRPGCKWIVEAPDACSVCTANGRPDLHLPLCLALCSCCRLPGICGLQEGG